MSQEFAKRLIAWHEQHGRKSLPWQTDPGPYRVWVSEIMLQQTQVTTVVPYYERFMERFPDADSLAAAEVDEVLHYWSGLGYYARGRNLHKAARIVRDEYRGRLPEDLESLMSLPGIGRSTAGAILALSGDRRFPILDGNVKRVLARHRAVPGWPGEREVENTLWGLAESMTPAASVAAYTQAIMDLGATVCVRGRPLCDACPVASDCCARARGEQALFPGKRPKKARPTRRSRMILVLRPDRSVLLERRPPAGVWGGLWGFPELEEVSTAEEWCRERLGCQIESAANWPVVQHAFTHFDLHIQPILARLEGEVSAVMDGERWVWYNTGAPRKLGLAAPVARLLRRLASETENEHEPDGQMRLAGC